MLKIKLEYDLPVYDPEKHDPNKTFAFLTYRGVHYAKWVCLKPRSKKNWKISNKEGLDDPLFYCYNTFVTSPYHVRRT